MILLAVIAVACLAWALALQRRLSRAADLEHELRGALTAVGLAMQQQGDSGLTAAYEGQLARVRGARGAGSAERWPLERLIAGATVPAGGAVVLGNLVANAVEHGDGPAVVRIEVVNRIPDRSLNGYGPHGGPNASTKRGRGLRIAARAARAAGGRLDVHESAGRFAAAVELPVER